jgi:hypothetical protein
VVEGVKEDDVDEEDDNEDDDDDNDVDDHQFCVQIYMQHIMTMIMMMRWRWLKRMMFMKKMIKTMTIITTIMSPRMPVIELMLD